MIVTGLWLALLALTVLSGLLLLPGWWRGRLAPPPAAIGLHAGLAVLTLTGGLLLFERQGWLAAGEFGWLAAAAGSGAMLLNARRKQAAFPRWVIAVHLLATAALAYSQTQPGA